MSTIISGTNGVTFPDSTSMQTGQQACKAWVNFNGTGTVAIRESFNVSSITDNGTGDYTINFTNAFADTNYNFVSTVGQGGVTATGYNHSSAPPSTTSLRIYVFTTNAVGAYDTGIVNFTFFR